MRRNGQCYCGSHRKYKFCHLFLDQGWVKKILGIRKYVVWMHPDARWCSTHKTSRWLKGEKYCEVGKSKLLKNCLERRHIWQ